MIGCSFSFIVIFDGNFNWEIEELIYFNLCDGKYVSIKIYCF